MNRANKVESVATLQSLSMRRECVVAEAGF